MTNITKPMGYWNSKKENLRMFFESFAAHKNLDPLNPSTWYTSSLDFSQYQVWNLR